MDTSLQAVSKVNILITEYKKYNKLIDKWYDKAREFYDVSNAITLSRIQQEITDLENYRNKGLIDESAIKEIYAIYFQYFEVHYKTYCDYVGVDTQAATTVIASISRNLKAVLPLLKKSIRAEIDKNAVMSDIEIDASLAALKMIATQHGYNTGSK